MVRAKMRCESIEPANPFQGDYSIRLSPVVSGSPENEQFYKWTPGGSVHLFTINEAAAKQFEVGKEFYVDFTPAN